MVIGDTLMSAVTLTSRHLADRQGLNITSAAVLQRLERNGPVRLTGLAAEVGITQPAMTELVQRLIKQGVVSRVSDPADGRVALIEITAAGRQLISERWQAHHERLGELLAALPAVEVAALALAMSVAQPIIQRLIDTATGTPGGKQ